MALTRDRGEPPVEPPEKKNARAKTEPRRNGAVGVHGWPPHSALEPAPGGEGASRSAGRPLPPERSCAGAVRALRRPAKAESPSPLEKKNEKMEQNGKEIVVTESKPKIRNTTTEKSQLKKEK